jgi:hypothetical protein
MNILADTDRRAPHREDKAEAARCAFNRKAADDRAALMAHLDEFLAALRKEEMEKTA